MEKKGCDMIFMSLRCTGLGMFCRYTRCSCIVKDVIKEIICIRILMRGVLITIENERP